MCIRDRLWAARHGTLPRVAILDQRAPDAASPRQDDSDAALMLAFAGKVSALVGTDIGIGADQIAEGAEAAFLAAFQRHGLAPEDTRQEDFARYLKLMLAHNGATQGYRPVPYGGDVVVLRARHALIIAGAEPARAGEERDRLPDLGWQRWCSGTCTVVPVPGNHVTMIRPPHVALLAAVLDRELEQP